MADFIVTKGAKFINRKLTDDDFQSVTFSTYKRKVKDPSKEKEKGKDSKIDDKDDQEAEMKRLRWDVMKFARNFDGTKTVTHKANVELALKLGAKPMKNRKTNYKKLIELNKQKKLEKEQQEKSNMNSGLSLSLKKPKVNKKKKFIKKNDGILNVYGKVDRKSAKMTN